MKIYNKKDFKEKYKDIDDKKFTDIYNFLKGKKTKIGIQERNYPFRNKSKRGFIP
ncbi:hypothetical protein [Fusobacterium polymorphum]|uniref:hypothetical protein n=1 Tax=Fusobacterium nucleatum subsp. polymorphum TaxID=76857 RepID=UPI0030CC619B